MTPVRSTNGYFLPGNKEGKGNPLGSYQARFRAMLYKCCKKKDFKLVCKRLIQDAISGDNDARKLLIGRLVGKETQPIEISGIPIKLYDVDSTPEAL
jgi:hypothetical protein